MIVDGVVEDVAEVDAADHKAVCRRAHPDAVLHVVDTQIFDGGARSLHLEACRVAAIAVHVGPARVPRVSAPHGSTTDAEVGAASQIQGCDAGPAHERRALGIDDRMGREAGRAVRQAKGLAHFTLGQRRLSSEEIGLDPRDRGRHAPSRGHLAPRIGEPDPDLLGRRGRGGGGLVSGSRQTPSRNGRTEGTGPAGARGSTRQHNPNN